MPPEDGTTITSARYGDGPPIVLVGDAFQHRAFDPPAAGRRSHRGAHDIGGAHSMVHMFGQIGAGQWFRYLIGSLELADALGMLIPALSGVAALALSALMAGASITNAFIIHTSPLVPLVLLVISVLVAWGRWPQTRALAARATR